ncbi:MAG: dihydroorotase, partial [Prevotella sp.]|nr:dihydroorotase [Prevotella sp.]
MKTILKNGIIVNEGVSERASVVITDDRITDIIDSNMSPRENYDNTVDLAGCFVFPGIIDSHVHFREPGMTHKADMESESREA